LLTASFSLVDVSPPTSQFLNIFNHLKLKLSDLSNIFGPIFQVYSDTFFFTATINSWQSLLEDDAFKEIVIESLEYMCKPKRIALYSYVVMPNHIHLLFTLLNTEKQANF